MTAPLPESTPRRPSHRRLILAAVAAAVLSAAAVLFIGLLANLNRPSAPPVYMFDTQNIGTPQAQRALEFAGKVGVDQIIPYDLTPENYTLQPGSLPSGPGCSVITRNQRLAQVQAANVPVCNELVWAQTYHVKVDPAFDGLLENTQANDEKVINTVRLLDGSPAVGMYFIDDELPADPGQADTVKWLQALKSRCDLLRSLTSKPIMGVFTWGDDLAANNYPRYRFLEQIHATCPSMMLGVDYYPSPQTATSIQDYGPIGDIRMSDGSWLGGIPQIGGTLHAVAGLNTVFVGQAFGWSGAYPDQTHDLGFPANAPPPSTQLMTWMLRAAVYGEGHGGVGAVCLYSYGDALKSGGEAQVQAMAQAIAAFKANP